MVETYSWSGAGGVFETCVDPEDWAWDGFGGECDCGVIGDGDGKRAFVVVDGSGR
jgi:hypothetical protein